MLLSKSPEMARAPAHSRFASSNQIPGASPLGGQSEWDALAYSGKCRNCAKVISPGGGRDDLFLQYFNSKAITTFPPMWQSPC
jgi:hypothetical protein